MEQPTSAKYRYADCTLFRVPPIDIASVRDRIETALAQAWDKGVPAERAIDGIVGNARLTSSLSEQIAPNLEYQRQQALQQVAIKKEDAIRQYDSERDARIMEVEAGVGAVVQQHRQSLEQLQEAVQGEQGLYSASEKKLRELRESVRRQVTEIGGVEGYKTLAKIQEAVMGEEAHSQASTAYEAPKETSGPQKENAPEITLEEIVKNDAPPRLARIWNRLLRLFGRGVDYG